MVKRLKSYILYTSKQFLPSYPGKTGVHISLKFMKPPVNSTSHGMVTHSKTAFSIYSLPLENTSEE